MRSKYFHSFGLNIQITHRVSPTNTFAKGRPSQCGIFPFISHLRGPEVTGEVLLSGGQTCVGKNGSV